jgi:hypothetical protein
MLRNNTFLNAHGSCLPLLTLPLPLQVFLCTNTKTKAHQSNQINSNAPTPRAHAVLSVTIEFSNHYLKWISLSLRPLLFITSLNCLPLLLPPSLSLCHIAQMLRFTVLRSGPATLPEPTQVGASHS